MPSKAERGRRREARRRWAIYRQYLHHLSEPFKRDWHSLVALRASDHAPLDAPLEERLRESPAVKALEARLRWVWPEAPWDLHELRPDEFWDPTLTPPADPALREAWEIHRKALEPPRGRRIREPREPLTMARGCFLESDPWSCLPATSTHYRRLVVWDLRHSPPWASRPNGELWGIAVTLFPEDDTVSALRLAQDSIERNEFTKKLTGRVLQYLRKVEGDLATLRRVDEKKGRYS